MGWGGWDGVSTLEEEVRRFSAWVERGGEEEEEEEEGEEEAATSMRPAEVPGASSLSYV